MKKEYEKPDLKLLVFYTEVIANGGILDGSSGVSDEDMPEGWE